MMVTKDDVIAVLNSLEKKLLVNKKFLKEDDFENFRETIHSFKMIVSRKVIDLNSIMDQIRSMNKHLDQKIAPNRIYADDPFYNHPIRKICYRGVNQVPLTENGEGVFQLGFTKKEITDKKYAYHMNKLLSMFGNQSRIVSPLVSNLATSVAVSKEVASAAVFPNPYGLNKLKTSDVLMQLKLKLHEKNIKLDIKTINEKLNEAFKLQLNETVGENYGILEKDLLTKIINDKIEESNSGEKIDLTSLFTDVENQLLENIPKKDKIWIYVVYIEKGFDVHSRGYLAAVNNEFKNEEQELLFAHEICTDSIPPKHVIAAFEVERDFRKLNQDYLGEATFLIKNTVYNQIALDHLKEHKINVEKYQKLIEEFVQNNKNNNGNQINTRTSGYVPQEKNLTPK